MALFKTLKCLDLLGLLLQRPLQSLDFHLLVKHLPIEHALLILYLLLHPFSVFLLLSLPEQLIFSPLFFFDFLIPNHCFNVFLLLFELLLSLFLFLFLHQGLTHLLLHQLLDVLFHFLLHLFAQPLS